MAARIHGLVVRLGVVLVLVAGLMIGGPLTAGVTVPKETGIVGGAR